VKAQSLRVFLGTAIAAACVSVVTPVATSLTATVDPADNQASNDKLFALLSGGFTPADCQAARGLPGTGSLPRFFATTSTFPAAPTVPFTPCTEIPPI